MKTETKSNIGMLTFGILVLLITMHFTNIAGVVFGQGDSLPFEIGDIFEYIENPIDNLSNSTTPNSTNFQHNDEITNCDMPPCPPGQVCIQSCP